jgi:hypothetical protein
MFSSEEGEARITAANQALPLDLFTQPVKEDQLKTILMVVLDSRARYHSGNDLRNDLERADRYHSVGFCVLFLVTMTSDAA